MPSDLVITLPPPVRGQSPYRRGFYPNIQPSTFTPVVKFPDSAKGVKSYWRLIHCGFFYSNSAVVANRNYGIEPVGVDDFGTDTAYGGILTAVTVANGWGKVTLSQQGYLSSTMAVLNHGGGGYGQINNDMIFSGKDYIKFWNFNPQAGDYFNISFTFQYLNHIHRIYKPG